MTLKKTNFVFFPSQPLQNEISIIITIIFNNERAVKSVTGLLAFQREKEWQGSHLHVTMKRLSVPKKPKSVSWTLRQGNFLSLSHKEVTIFLCFSFVTNKINEDLKNICKLVTVFFPLFIWLYPFRGIVTILPYFILCYFI
jgi:hypothetical protein